MSRALYTYLCSCLRMSPQLSVSEKETGSLNCIISPQWGHSLLLCCFKLSSLTNLYCHWLWLAIRLSDTVFKENAKCSLGLSSWSGLPCQLSTCTSMSQLVPSYKIVYIKTKTDPTLWGMRRGWKEMQKEGSSVCVEKRNWEGWELGWEAWTIEDFTISIILLIKMMAFLRVLSNIIV